MKSVVMCTMTAVHIRLLAEQSVNSNDNAVRTDQRTTQCDIILTAAEVNTEKFCPEVV